MKKSNRKRLALAAETVRTIAARDLAGAAGGEDNPTNIRATCTCVTQTCGGCPQHTFNLAWCSYGCYQ